ncbi:MAG: TraR/DksA family transcriptional regulator [Rhodospirillales bacterium]|nr:TraR/DksA family transcriptional regulator [Rhodospirillales bacterium]
MAKRTDIDITTLKKQLLAQRQEILADAASSEQARQPVELDQTSVGRLSRMDALQDQAMALETGRRRQAELQHIELALKRIDDDDDFGECQNCGEDIAAKRLQINPTVTICIDCAS